MSAISLFDLISLGSGLALFALFASAHPGATAWRGRLVLAFVAAGLAAFAGLAFFYRPSSWGPLLADIFAGDWTQWARFATACLIGVFSGRALRRALDRRHRLVAAPPSPPQEPDSASARDPAPVVAQVWNKFPPLRRPPDRAPAPSPPVETPRPAQTVSPPPPPL